jgi:ABC-type antimicrobial peptide transport system permease subunit
MENAYRDDIKETTSAQYLVSLEQANFFEARWRTLFVRTNGDPAIIGPQVRQQLQSLRPDLPYASVRTMKAVIAPQLDPWRLGATMFGLFGGIALLVAAIGLYAVVAYDVSQRWHELGVRSALGARPRHILGLIVGDGVRHAVLGLAVGGAITWWIAPRAADMLFGIAPRDPVTFAVVAGVLLVAATIACLMPARRAAHVAPADVLRSD